MQWCVPTVTTQRMCLLRISETSTHGSRSDLTTKILPLNTVAPHDFLSPSLFMEERQMGTGHQTHARGSAWFLGKPRVPHLWRPVARAALLGRRVMWRGGT